MARFSEFLEACMAEGPQMVTKRGTDMLYEDAMIADPTDASYSDAARSAPGHAQHSLRKSSTLHGE